MNIYPLPSEWEERSNDDEEINCFEIQFSSNGMCPCCGDELVLREITQTYGGAVQQCKTCHWESTIHYDL